MILDTSILIDVQRNSPRAVEKVMELEARGRPKRVPLVAVYELFVGVGKELGQKRIDGESNGSSEISRLHLLASRLRSEQDS